MLRSKVFEFKGQAINYYNKVRKSSNIEICWLELNMKNGWMVYWKYKKEA